MSVLIKGMVIPPNCFLCNLSYMKGERLFCSVTREEVIRAKRAIECPIIEIPPHGRLIDADTLIIDLLDRGIECLQTDDFHEIQQAVDAAPTILEAEESE